MIPGISLVELISTFSIWGVMLIIFAESGLLVGFFLPGDSILFTTGFLIVTGILSFNIHIAVLLIFFAAILGDNVGYAFGRRTGSYLFNKPNARIFKQEYIQRAQAFYEKHGGKTILLARFIPIIRTFAPIVAGASKMPYRRFALFNLAGGLLWTAGVTYAGYFLGKWFQMIGLSIDEVLLPAIAVIILISILPPLIHVLSNKETRQGLWQAAKRQFGGFIGKK